MKRYIAILLISFGAVAFASDAEKDAEKCQTFLKEKGNYKKAHENKYCLKAADAGIGAAQYSVGMAFGFSGEKEQEKKYYRLAANNRSIAAYLALGHVLREEKPWEAIYWYQRYVHTKGEAYGYAALLISEIFNELGDKEQSLHWYAICQTSPSKQSCK